MWFVRASFDPDLDIARGFSATGGLVLSDGPSLRRAARELVELEGLDIDIDEFDDDELEDLLREYSWAYHPQLDGWGPVAWGLWSYVAFESLEEARVALEAGEIAFGGDCGYSTVAALWAFEGELAYGNELEDGILFHPVGAYAMLRPAPPVSE